MRGWGLVFSVLVASVAGRSMDATNSNHLGESEARKNGEDVTSTLLGDLKSVLSIYNSCAGDSLSSCLKLKLVSTMDRAARSFSGDLNIIEGVTLVRDSSTSQEGITPVPSEEELEASLPRALDDKEERLDSMVIERMADFLQKHTLKVKLSAAENLQRSLSEEGRKRGGGGGGGKRNGNMLLLPLLMGAMLIPVALGALALLAGKALIISKLALVLAAIIGLKKLVSSGHHDGGTQVVTIPSGHGGHGWGRSAHELAYRGHIPSTETKQ